MEKILTQNIVIPASTIVIYSQDGSFLTTKDVSGRTNGMTSTETAPITQLEQPLRLVDTQRHTEEPCWQMH